MPEWLHNRAMHILAKNPAMGKGQAFAIATEQSHATGHTPKGYGTASAKHEAKAKYDEPKKEYEQKSDPGAVGKKLERAEDRGAVAIKQANLAAALRLHSTLNQAKQLEDLREEIAQIKKNLPAPPPQPEMPKQAGLMLGSPFDPVVIAAFSDELQKIANVGPTPGAPATFSEIKSTIPTKPLSGKTPKYSKVNAAPSPSPLVGQQPLAEPPGAQ